MTSIETPTPSTFKDSPVKTHLKFAASVAAVIVAIALVQKNFMNVPVVGDMLPGYTPRA